MAPIANTAVSPLPPMIAASQVPNTTPTTVGMAHAFSNGQSTTPFALWLSVERIDVGIIVASEVPTAIGIRTLSSTPRIASV